MSYCTSLSPTRLSYAHPSVYPVKVRSLHTTSHCDHQSILQQQMKSKERHLRPVDSWNNFGGWNGFHIIPSYRWAGAGSSQFVVGFVCVKRRECNLPLRQDSSSRIVLIHRQPFLLLLRDSMSATFWVVISRMPNTSFISDFQDARVSSKKSKCRCHRLKTIQIPSSFQKFHKRVSFLETIQTWSFFQDSHIRRHSFLDTQRQGNIQRAALHDYACCPGTRMGASASFVACCFKSDVHKVCMLIYEYNVRACWDFWKQYFASNLEKCSPEPCRNRKHTVGVWE